MKKKAYNTPELHIITLRIPRILAASESIPVTSDDPITSEDVEDIGAKGTSMDFWGDED